MSSNKTLSLDLGFRNLVDLHDRLSKSGGSEDVKASVKKSIELINARDEYCRRNTMSDTPNARMISEKTSALPWETLHKEETTLNQYNNLWMSGMGQAQLLQFIARMQKARNALEIGMFTGYVAMAIAEVLPEDGNVVTLEIDPYLVQFARETFAQTSFDKKIDVRQGSALDSLDMLANEGRTFDLVYLDCDKPRYLQYFKKLLDQDLLAVGGTIVVDNAFENGVAYTQPCSAIDTFNDFVMADPRVDQIMLPLSDGVSLIRRKKE